MFEAFFYQLRDHGVAVSPTNFLQLQKALQGGLVLSLEDLYVVTRALLVKKERQFDLYDRLFAHHFKGAELPEDLAQELHAEIEAMLREWLSDPQTLAELPEDVREAIQGMSPEELVQYFKDRLADQDEAHHGGNRWIGTGGTSPVGHSGYHPGGMRVGGRSRNKSAVKVAMERRYLDYSDEQRLSSQQMAEALRTLRHLAPMGPRDELNIDETIRETVRQGGEIQLAFDRRLRDRLRVFLFIDNGGLSMDPYVARTRTLFQHARDIFSHREEGLRTFFFHNCIYDTVWEDPQRRHKPVPVEELLRADPATRLIFVGDASMAPWELFHRHGAIDTRHGQGRAGIVQLEALAARFEQRVWINPIERRRWSWTEGTQTLQAIAARIDMVDLSLSGIERAVELLMGRRA